MGTEEGRNSPTAAPVDGPAKECCGWITRRARRQPLQCVGLALMAGAVGALLPIGRIAGFLLQVILTLARPILLIFGAVKIFEELEKRRP